MAETFAAHSTCFFAHQQQQHEPILHCVRVDRLWITVHVTFLAFFIFRSCLFMLTFV